MANDSNPTGGRSMATRRGGIAGSGVDSPAKRRLDVLESRAVPMLGRDPRGDAPQTAIQAIFERFLRNALALSALALVGALVVYWSLASQETQARVEQERILRDGQYLDGLKDATAAGSALAYTCGAAAGLGADDSGPGSKWWDLRKTCLNHWGDQK